MGQGLNPLVNPNDLPLDRSDDLELPPETYLTDTDPLRTGGYDHYRTMLPGKYTIISEVDVQVGRVPDT